MATTTLALRNNRRLNEVVLSANIASVAIDAQVAENFALPNGFGDLWIHMIEAQMSAMSANKVDSTHQAEGFSCEIISSDTSTLVDMLGAYRWVARGGTAARPILMTTFDPERSVLLRQQELLQIVAPITAGAGATATIACTVRGIRYRQA